jgi:hypothetical protein
MRAAVLAFVLIVSFPAAGWAEWQAKPFIGVTFGGSNTLLALDQVAGEKKLTVGGSVTWLGNFYGIEGEVARVPGFFQTVSQQNVLTSNVTTLTGNLIVTLPRKLTQYGLRPYFAGGGGVVRAVADAQTELLSVDTTLGLVNLGGGATGFLNDRIGVNWDVRYFRSVGGKEGTGLAIGREQLSFWRASMGVAVRLGPPPGATR